MFRQEEVLFGGWREKTLEAMQKRRFELAVGKLPPLGMGRLEALEPKAFSTRLEQSWQDVERKPMRAQQLEAIRRSIIETIDLQADFLSRAEHELVERALILGGSAQIEDLQELEAAQALSLRLWASVGLVSGKPYLELETPVLQAAARAFSRPEHETIRERLSELEGFLTGTLYRVGAMDDRQPQRLLLRELPGGRDERQRQIARRFLWATYDCVDYDDGVMLLYRALADPYHLIMSRRRKTGLLLPPQGSPREGLDILPEEIPLQRNLERAIAGALRSGVEAQDAARSLRFLCKQGAPLRAMEDVLQSFLIVMISPTARSALSEMYYRIPKWIECAEIFPSAQ